MSDPVVEKTELVIEILHYAQEHNMDINNRDDVRKILKSIHVDQPEEEFEVLMDQLEYANTFIDKSAKEINSKKTNLPN